MYSKNSRTIFISPLDSAYLPGLQRNVEAKVLPPVQLRRKKTPYRLVSPPRGYTIWVKERTVILLLEVVKFSQRMTT